jgi:hypothetical protein
MNDDNGLVYRTSEAAYSVELALPSYPISDEPYGVDLVRTTQNEHGLEREQRLTLAEYYSYMAAEEHVRELETKFLDQGRAGLSTEMALVETQPYEPDTAIYWLGRYPPDPEAEEGSLTLLRLDGSQLDLASVAHGPLPELADIEQRLVDIQAEGDTTKFLDAVASEAVNARELAPGSPLFATEGFEKMSQDQVLPVTLADDLTPFTTQGQYVPHHRDEASTIHFFSVVDLATENDAPEQELRYFRAQKTDGDLVVHDSLPIMVVDKPDPSPWPLPALNLYLEEGELGAAQSLAREMAHEHGFTFPDTLPALGTPDVQPASGWYHFDTALVAATPQGIDDGYSVGVVDVYANHEDNQWAARYLPLGEYSTFDAALERQHSLLHQRLVEGRDSAYDTNGFNHSPALYERFAQREAENTLTDLLEKYDGHYPPDYDGDLEPEWEPLTSKEWQAYQDHVQVISDIVPGQEQLRRNLPSTTPSFASEALVASSQQPDAPFHLPSDFKVQEVAPIWRLDIVPAHDPDGARLGYSAVCVVDFGDLAEAIAPDSTERAMWLEVAQFQTEDRAKQFQDDFMSLAGSEELYHITGPALAGFIADDLGMDSQWQAMNKHALEQLKAGEWGVTHPHEAWQPRLDEASPDHAVEVINLDIDL